MRCGLEHLIPRIDDTEQWSSLLSGGEQQRLAFARVLIHPPDILIMDEPTSSLDELSQFRMMEYMRDHLPDTMVALTAFVTSITSRVWQRSPNSTAGSAASSVTLGEVARCSPDEALQRLGSSAIGLTMEAVEGRLRSTGPNEVAHEARHTILGEIVSRSLNPLNLLLLTLAAASYFVGDQRAAFVIAVMVLLSVSLGFFQEHRSTKAADALRRMVLTNATVRRQDGGTAQGHSDVPIGHLVPGDIVLLSAGDIIPADVRLISANDLFINQSTLTGEAMPLEKNAQPHVGSAETPFDLPNICFMGSAVVSGVGCGVVVLTGARTAFGQVAGTIAEQRVLTSFDKGVTRVTWMMLGLIAIMVPLVFLINGLSKGNWFEALLFAVAVAVGLTPEMLPMIVTVNLAKGAMAMSQEEGHRQAPQCDPELRGNGRLVHGQDRHAHAGPDHPQAPSRSQRRRFRPRSRIRLSEQLPPVLVSRTCSTTRSCSTSNFTRS